MVAYGWEDQLVGKIVLYHSSDVGQNFKLCVCEREREGEGEGEGEGERE